ncbi:hypothetical protein Tco_0766098 [Tanacetum coccineum]
MSCWELNTSELVLLSQQLVLLEENSSYCSRLQLPVLNQSVNTARITAIGEKVNAAESLLVVSTERNGNSWVLFLYTALANQQTGPSIRIEDELCLLLLVEKICKKNDVKAIRMQSTKELKGHQENWNQDDMVLKLHYIKEVIILEGRTNSLNIKESEVLFSEEIALLKRSVGHKDNLMGLLEKLEKAKDLDQLLASQITDKTKKGFGYNDVPSPHPLILNRPTPLDLSYSGLEEFKEPEVNEYGPRDSSLTPTTGCNKESDNSKENTDDSLKQQQKTDSKTSSVKSPLKVDNDWKEKFFSPANQVKEVEPKKVREKNDAPIIEDWVSDDEDEVETTVVVKKKTVIPTAAKIEKPVRKPVRYAEIYRSQRPRGNQRNWNGQKSNQLGSDFVMHNKACYICGSFDHLQYTCKHKRHVNDKKQVKPVWKNTRRVNDYYSTRMTHSNPRRNMIPQAVLMRSGIKAVNTAKPKDAHNVVKRNWFHDVKASACWVWRPKQKEILDNVSKHNKDDVEDPSKQGRKNAQIDKDHFGSDGCIDSGEARVQQRKRRIQRRVQQKQKDQEDEMFGRILSAKKMKIKGLNNLELQRLLGFHNWYQSHRAVDLGSTRFIEDVITKKIVYHLFDDEVEFLGCVILSYLLALEITCSCFHDFIDKDLIDLVLPDVRREMITSQLQGKLWLYDEVRTWFCHHQIGEDCWDS